MSEKEWTAKIQAWRDHAEECRILAYGCHHPHTRTTLLSTAAAWDKMADWMEKQHEKDKPQRS